jgi:chitin disaccharide deacetylase
MKKLIVNADDLGASGGTAQAVKELYEAGILISTTALVNQPEWPQAAEYLRDHPKLGAGVHLVMNEGAPVLPAEQARSLVDGQGQFYRDAVLLRRFGRLHTGELEAEWRAQIEKFIRDSGRQPDHLDLHCHFPYVFPSWFRVSLKLAKEYGNLPVRLPFDKALESKAPLMAAKFGFPAWFVLWQGRRYQKMVAKYGLKHPDYLEESFSLRAPEAQRTPEYLLQLFENLPEGITELLCHPGTEVEWRQKDYQVLRDVRLLERIRVLGVELVTYRELGSAT